MTAAALLRHEPPRPSGRDELGLIAALEWLKRRARLLIAIPLAVAVLVAVIVLVLPSRYTSSTTILPETRAARLPGGLSGIAGQLGFSLPGEAGQSPQFYAQAATSRVLLTRLLNTRFHLGTVSKPLIDHLGIRGADSLRRLDNGIKRLRDRMGTSTNTKTGTVTIWVETKNRALSRDVLDTLLGELNRLNLSTRRSQASEKRKFLADRQESARGELAGAEASLRQFYEANRQWEQSPGLRVREGQLRRRVDAAEQLYTTLTREFEMARVQEFDDIPVFSVVDPPFEPARRSYPNRRVWVVFAAIATFIAALAVLAVHDYLEAHGMPLWPRQHRRPDSTDAIA